MDSDADELMTIVREENVKEYLSSNISRNARTKNVKNVKNTKKFPARISKGLLINFKKVFYDIILM